MPIGRPLITNPFSSGRSAVQTPFSSAAAAPPPPPPPPSYEQVMGLREPSANQLQSLPMTLPARPAYRSLFDGESPRSPGREADSPPTIGPNDVAVASKPPASQGHHKPLFPTFASSHAPDALPPPPAYDSLYSSGQTSLSPAPPSYDNATSPSGPGLSDEQLSMDRHPSLDRSRVFHRGSTNPAGQPLSTGSSLNPSYRTSASGRFPAAAAARTAAGGGSPYALGSASETVAARCGIRDSICVEVRDGAFVIAIMTDKGQLLLHKYSVLLSRTPVLPPACPRLADPHGCPMARPASQP